MKGDPDDLRLLIEDLRGCISRHPDAIRSNPDIASDIVKARDHAAAKYARITEDKPPKHPLEP